MEFEGRSRIDSHLDIAPLIDVIFLLLIFFMLTSTFLPPEAVELSLPESSSAEAVEQTYVTVTIDHEEGLTLNGKTIQLGTLGEALKPFLKEDPGTVTLKSDARVEVQTLLKVMDAIRSAGGDNIALATARISPP
ncbi:biopolymer transporter ExbD [Nitrospira defluvii]|nr:biopolymer transporter ExbD [Nitrospira defluvii]